MLKIFMEYHVDLNSYEELTMSINKTSAHETVIEPDAQDVDELLAAIRARRKAAQSSLEG